MNSLSRPLSSTERAVWLLDQASPLNGCIAARIAGPRPARDEIAAALACMQRRHPLLRARVVGAIGALRWEAAAEPIRLTDGAGDGAALLEAALAEPFDPREGSLARLAVAPAAGGFTLGLSFHHVIGDALGGIFVMRDLLRSLADRAAGGGGELAPLPARPGLGDLRPPEARGLPLLRALTRFSTAQARALLRRPRHLRADEEAAPRARRTRLVHRVLDEASTARLAARCRREDTTVQGALTAALLEAAAEDLASAAPTIGCFHAVNLRERCAPPIGEEMGLYVSQATTFHRVGDGSWALAREVKRALSRAVADGEPWITLPMLGLFVPAGGDDLPARFAARVDGRAPSAIGVTNLGRLPIEPRIGDFTVEELHAAPGLGVVTPLVACCSTFGGRLTWNQLFVEPLITRARAERVADAALARLSVA